MNLLFSAKPAAMPFIADDTERTKNWYQPMFTQCANVMEKLEAASERGVGAGRENRQKAILFHRHFDIARHRAALPPLSVRPASILLRSQYLSVLTTLALARSGLRPPYCYYNSININIFLLASTSTHSYHAEHLPSNQPTKNRRMSVDIERNFSFHFFLRSTLLIRRLRLIVIFSVFVDLMKISFCIMNRLHINSHNLRYCHAERVLCDEWPGQRRKGQKEMKCWRHFKIKYKTVSCVCAVCCVCIDFCRPRSHRRQWIWAGCRVWKILTRQSVTNHIMWMRALDMRMTNDFGLSDSNKFFGRFYFLGFVFPWAFFCWRKIQYNRLTGTWDWDWDRDWDSDWDRDWDYPAALYYNCTSVSAHTVYWIDGRHSLFASRRFRRNPISPIYPLKTTFMNIKAHTDAHTNGVHQTNTQIHMEWANGSLQRTEHGKRHSRRTRDV